MNGGPGSAWRFGETAHTAAEADVCGTMGPVRAVLKTLDLEPDPATLPSDPAEFAFLARLYVGPPDSPGEESFDIIVCTPEWLSQQCQTNGGLYNPRHHLVVTLETFDKRALHAWLDARVREVQGATWHEIGERLGRLGYWELEDYTP